MILNQGSPVFRATTNIPEHNVNTPTHIPREISFSVQISHVRVLHELRGRRSEFRWNCWTLESHSRRRRRTAIASDNMTIIKYGSVVS